MIIKFGFLIGIDINKLVKLKSLDLFGFEARSLKMSNITPKRFRIITKLPSPPNSPFLRSQPSTDDLHKPQFSQRPKLSQSQSPLSKKLSSSQESKPKTLKKDQKSSFSRFSSQQFLNEIFAGVRKTEDFEKKTQKSGQITKNLPEKNQIPLKGKIFSKTSKDFYSELHEQPESLESEQCLVDKSEISPEFRADSPVCSSGKQSQNLNNSMKSSLRSQKSDPQSFKIAEKLSKDFSLVFRKKVDPKLLEKHKFVEDIKGKDAELTGLRQFIHETMNRIYGLKIKLASYNSSLTPFAKSSGFVESSKTSVFDLKSRLSDDLEKIFLMIERVFSDLSELNDCKLREKELKRQLSEANEREVFLQTKLEIEKNKTFNISNQRIESERSFDKKETNFTKERLNYQQKIQELENEICKLQREKDLAFKNSKDNSLQSEKFSFYARNMEIEMVKCKEQATRFQKEAEILKEKIKNKDVTEELLRLKLKNFEENTNFETKGKTLSVLNEKIGELEENLRLKNAEIMELKYKLCLPSHKSSEIEEIQDKSVKILSKIQEISTLTKNPEISAEKFVKSQSKELKKLKICLDLLQKENLHLTKNKEKLKLIEKDNEDLTTKQLEYEETIRTLEKDNFQLKNELIEALDCIDTVEKSSLVFSTSTKQQKVQINQLQKSKESILEESQNLRHSLSLKSEKLQKHMALIETLKSENLQKSNENDSLSNELNRLKSTIASKALEQAYLSEKESIFKSQLDDCVSEMKQIKQESKKLKEENFKQAQELTRKNFEISDLIETEKKLRQEIIENVLEIQLLNKNLKESQIICESQKGLLLSLGQEKSEIHARLDRACEENVGMKGEIEGLRKEIEVRDEKLMEALEYERRINGEIEGIEEEIRKQPRRGSLKLNEEMKVANEEKFRLKSLIVYKNTQIKMLKDKVEGMKKGEEIKVDGPKRHKSLVWNKDKKK